MNTTENAELIRKASHHVAVALETLNQMWAIYSFGHQILVDADTVRNETKILMEKYRSELRRSSQLLVQFLEREKPILEIPPL